MVTWQGEPRKAHISGWRLYETEMRGSTGEILATFSRWAPDLNTACNDFARVAAAEGMYASAVREVTR